jgi:hypothetical protein
MPVLSRRKKQNSGRSSQYLTILEIPIVMLEEVNVGMLYVRIFEDQYYLCKFMGFRPIIRKFWRLGHY